MQSDLERIRPAVTAVLQRSLSKIDTEERECSPHAGGKSGGGVWSDGVPENKPILEWFDQTLDKYNPGQTIKTMKSLKKACVL